MIFQLLLEKKNKRTAKRKLVAYSALGVCVMGKEEEKRGH